MRDRRDWHMLCSCLDAIGDTEMALTAYREETQSLPMGKRYLTVYGVLQALYLQQDAVQNLATALKIPYQRDPLLTQVREVRNDAVGHPTSRYGKAFIFLIQMSLTESGFGLMTTYADGRPPRFSSANVRDLLATQQTTVYTVLERFIATLREDERRHREAFRNVNLAAIFPDALSYYFEKVYEGIHRPDLHEFGAVHVDHILEIVESFEKALGDRGLIAAYDTITYEIAEVRWPLEELRRFLRDDPSSQLNDKSARIFAFFCVKSLEQLRHTANEIDEEYAQNP